MFLSFILKCSKELNLKCAFTRVHVCMRVCVCVCVSKQLDPQIPSRPLMMVLGEGASIRETLCLTSKSQRLGHLIPLCCQPSAHEIANSSH